MADIVQTTDYITTTEGYRATADVRREVFGTKFPAATGVIVAGLLREGALIEISAIAVLPGASYDLSLDIAGNGTAAVQQLSAAGVVLASTPLVPVLTTLAGTAQVRIVLTGGLGGATFDNVWMGEL
jgi:hypothetical protein